MLPSLLATLILTSVSCVAEDKSGSDSKSLEGLLIGSWHSENVSDDLKMDLYWHFNDDKTAQYISKSSIQSFRSAQGESDIIVRACLFRHCRYQ